MHIFPERNFFQLKKTIFCNYVLRDKNLLDILRDPKRSFNCDESFVLLDPSKQQVVETKESKDVYFIHKTKPSSWGSVLATISTSGLILPPFIIYPYERIQTWMAKDQILSGFVNFSTKKGGGGILLLAAPSICV